MSPLQDVTEHLHGVTGTCLALVHTEGSALQHSGRKSNPGQRPPAEFARVEVGGRLW